MTEKTKTKPVTNAIPRRYRDNLVPSCAVGVPEPILQASEELRLAGLAAEQASAQRREAESEAKAAPHLDSEAGIEAVRRGEDPPPATAPEKQREAETGRQREKAAKAIAERAAVALERAIRQHADEWITAQRADAQERTQDALDAADELTEALGRLGESAGLVATLQTAPLGRVIEGARIFKARTPGFGSHSTAPQLLAELREMIAQTMPDPVPGELTPEQEELQRSQRGWRQLARGGVFVGGGE